MSPTGSNGNDGAFDRVEFGWYVVDCAENDAEQMEKTVSSFEESVALIIKRAGAKTMDQVKYGGKDKKLTGRLATTNNSAASAENWMYGGASSSTSSSSLLAAEDAPSTSKEAAEEAAEEKDAAPVAAVDA